MDEATECKQLLDALVRQFATLNLVVDVYREKDEVTERKKAQLLAQAEARCQGLVIDWVNTSMDDSPMTVTEVGVRCGRALCEDLIRRMDEALSPEPGEPMTETQPTTEISNDTVTKITTNATSIAASRQDGMATFRDIAAATGATLDEITATLTGRAGYVLNNSATDRNDWYVEITAD